VGLTSAAEFEVIDGDAVLVLPRLPDRSVDVVLTDPPYCSGGMFRGDRSQRAAVKYSQAADPMDFPGDSRDQRSFVAWAALWLAECWRIAKPGSYAAVFADWRQVPALTDAFQAGGWVWRGLFVWDKTRAVRPAAGRFKQQAEFVVWGSRGPMEQKMDGTAPTPDGVFTCATVAHAERVHLTEKPVTLLSHLLEIAPAGAVVLDPFCGSGSTGAAALRRGLRFVGVELDPGIAARARDRLRVEAAGVPARGQERGQGTLWGHHRTPMTPAPPLVDVMPMGLASGS